MSLGCNLFDGWCLLWIEYLINRLGIVLDEVRFCSSRLGCRNLIGIVIHPFLEIVGIGHEERTPEKEQELREYWSKKVAEGEERRKKQSILDKAAERHAARTPEQIAEIQQRAAERQKRISKEKAYSHYGDRILRYMDSLR